MNLLFHEQAASTPATGTSVSMGFYCFSQNKLRQSVQAIEFMVDGVIASGRAQMSPMLAELPAMVRHLDRLLNRHCFAAWLDAGELVVTREELNVLPLLQSLVAEFAPDAEAKDIELRLETTAAMPLSVVSDACLLREMLTHVIENAIRHTGRGAVRLFARRRGGRVLIRIADSGCGIARPDIPRIFDDGVRLSEDIHPGRLPRTGMGLALVARISRLTGIPVRVLSRPGKGSIFSFSLPCSPEAGSRVSVPTVSATARHEWCPPLVTTHARNPLAMLRVAVIDDETVVRQVLESRLREWGAQVRTYCSPDEATAAFGSGETPNVLICDHWFGKSALGLLFARRVKALFPRMIVILLTGIKHSPTIIGEAERAGIQLVMKPATPERLRAILDLAVANA